MIVARRPRAIGVGSELAVGLAAGRRT